MVTCDLCKYYVENLYWMGGQDSFFCKHPSHKENKYPRELNKEGNCKNYKKGFFKKFLTLIKLYWG